MVWVTYGQINVVSTQLGGGLDCTFQFNKIWKFAIVNCASNTLHIYYARYYKLCKDCIVVND